MSLLRSSGLGYASWRGEMPILKRVLTFVRGVDVDELRAAIREFGDYGLAMYDRVGVRLLDIDQRLSRIEQNLQRFVPPEPVKVICDNCKIDVILPAKHADKASDYIQNFGWTVDGEQILCPDCSKIRQKETA
jgi:hypothetical protein